MKKYPFLALVFLSLLLIGSTSGLAVDNPREQSPDCMNPCFWGYMSTTPIHSVPGGQVIVPPVAGATVELWFGSSLIASCITDSRGYYCLHIAPAVVGEYVIKLVGCFNQTVRWDNNGCVQIDFRNVMCVHGPITPVPGPPQSGAPPQ